MYKVYEVQTDACMLISFLCWAERNQEQLSWCSTREHSQTIANHLSFNYADEIGWLKRYKNGTIFFELSTYSISVYKVPCACSILSGQIWAEMVAKL